MSSKLSVRWKDYDVLWRLDRLSVVLDVPNTRRAVLTGCISRSIEIELVRRCVCAEKCGKINRIKAFILEELEEISCWGIDIG
jgi:hypothetical protein